MNLIQTQMGVLKCTPKLKAGETQPRSREYPNGYTKRHGTKTSNSLPSDK